MCTKKAEGVSTNHIEATEGNDVNNSAPAPQKTTRLMVLFSLYTALAGWIYNFDLGKISASTLSMTPNLLRLWWHCPNYGTV